MSALGNGGAEKGVSLLDLANGRGQTLCEEVCLSKNPAAPNSGHLLDVSVITVRGENEHFGVGKVFANLPGGFQPIEQRHRDVHHHHGGTKFSRQLHGLAAVLRFADHFDVAFVFQQRAKTLAHDLWSSASRTVIRFIDIQDLVLADVRSALLPPRACVVMSGILRQDGGAFARRGLDVKLPPTISNRSLMPSNPSRLLFLRVQHAFHLKAFAVVFYFHANGAVQFLNAHFRLAGLRMAGNIGERFLGDAKEHRSLVAVHLLHRRKGRQADADARLLR